MNGGRLFFRMTVLLVTALPACSAVAETPAAIGPDDQAKFFEAKVRPLLVDHCWECHAEKKQKGGLRLDSIQAVLKGGKNGAVLVAGKPEQSRLITAVSYKDPDLQMPPDEQLSPDQVQVLTAWVRMGVPWPASSGAQQTAKVTKSKRRVITEEDRRFWSFQPVQDPPVPAADDAGWSRNAVDKFIFAKLKAEGLSPAPEADRATLIRRVYFDLIGLPPTPADVDAFVRDTSPDAYEKLVDRLLASPRYGERWARHWLDVVRYAESDGYRQDAYRANAWPYRDYVIKSFNDDKPYDRFITEQLAGDEIAPDDPNVLVATGFLRHGLYEYNQRNVRQQWCEILNEVTDVTGDAFLGLSMGCARCHDHKFDPILQADYFKLQAFFTPLLPREDLPLATPKQKADHAAAVAAWEKKAADVLEQMRAIQGPLDEKIAAKTIGMFPPDIQAMIHKPVAQRTPLEQQLAELAYRQVVGRTEAKEIKLSAADQEKMNALEKDLGDFEALRPKPLLMGLVVTDGGPTAPPTLIPGHRDQQPIDPGYLTVLDGTSLQIPPITPTTTSTGRRTALAKWITQPSNPLTTRVIVNRIWQYHFGCGIVATSGDFGRLGDRPSHPELLDWLAKRFVEQGWSFKKMHRLLMTSAAYRQSALRPTPEIVRTKDLENRWLWRMNPRRLEAEEIRDEMLAVSGELDLKAGGESADATSPRRSIYTKIIRNTRDPILDVFDAPDAFGSTPTRNVTTTAPQALLMINGQWPLQRAEAFAARLAKECPSADPARIVETAYRLAYARPPEPDERAAAIAFLANAKASATPAVARATPARPNNAQPIVQAIPNRGTRAVRIRDGAAEDLLCAPSSAGLTGDRFTIEAIVLLDSLYPNASVRVIASQWDGVQTHPGWAFGVTSEKSKHQPRNLILQVVGVAGTKASYEVVASGMRLELHRPYYVAVSYDAGDRTENGTTFYLQDLSDNDASMQVVHIRHGPIGPCRSAEPLVIGGRSSRGSQGWDGLIDEIRLTAGVLTHDQLLLADSHGSAPAQVLGHWQFELQPGLLKDSTGQRDLTRSLANSGTTAAKRTTPGNSADPALVDFCHVLLNSNEFLYVD